MIPHLLRPSQEIAKSIAISRRATRPPLSCTIAGARRDLYAVPAPSQLG